MDEELVDRIRRRQADALADYLQLRRPQLMAFIERLHELLGEETAPAARKSGAQTVANG